MLSQIKHFKLFANCIPVRGFTRSIICDLQRNRFHFIPNDLVDLLEIGKQKELKSILMDYDDEDQETIQDYLDFLVKEGYIFFCEAEDLELFPALDLDWDSPSVITNSIIDVGNEYEQNFRLIFKQLEELGCPTVQIRFFRPVSISELCEVLNLLETSIIKSVELLLPFNEDFEDVQINDLVVRYLRISSLVIYSSPENKEMKLTISIRTKVSFIKEQILDSSHCGIISASYFTINLEMFTESQGHNSCLNRKISIDERGLIKNCPTLNTSYGSVETTALRDAILNPSFKSLWGIHKDLIESCKDCEFRHICTDCRAHLEVAISYEKPAKCKYDPYAGKWS